jgi:hypothetical protein
MRWEWIVVVYAAYFAAIAWTRGYSRGLRWGTVAALLATGLLTVLPPPAGLWMTIARNLLPVLLLLAGYRLSGLFFVAPMTSVEARLMAVDRRVFDAMTWTRHLRLQGSGCHAALELAYLCVYAMVPLGALTLVVSGASNQVATYWTVVLAACFTSYAMLPWLQTRPPRAIHRVAAQEDVPDLRRGLRRLNLAILRCSSNQVNTIPSGHVAAALAVSLMVLSTDVVLGLAFLTMALAIAVATVVGRYHYAVDSLAGAAVALVSWLCLGRVC